MKLGLAIGLGASLALNDSLTVSGQLADDTGSATMIGFPGEVAGLDNLWDPALGITIATGVATWTSQAGQASALAQATGTKQPTIVSPAQNGRSAIATDGSDDFMAVAFTRAAPRTTFIVGKWISATGTIWDGKSVNTNRMYRSAAAQLSLGNGGGGGGINVSASSDLTNFHSSVMVHTAAGTGSSYRSDSEAKQTLDLGATTIDGVTLGATGDTGNNGQCQILYLVDFAGNLSDGDVAKVQTYLTSIFAL